MTEGDYNYEHGQVGKLGREVDGAGGVQEIDD